MNGCQNKKKSCCNRIRVNLIILLVIHLIKGVTIDNNHKILTISIRLQICSVVLKVYLPKIVISKHLASWLGLPDMEIKHKKILRNMN
jgi:hypothetical protein